MSMDSLRAQGERSTGEDKNPIPSPCWFSLLESSDFFPLFLKWQLIPMLPGGLSAAVNYRERRDGTWPAPPGDFPPARVLDWDGDRGTRQLGTAGKLAGKRDEEHRALPGQHFQHGKQRKSWRCLNSTPIPEKNPGIGGLPKPSTTRQGVTP